MNSLKVLLIYCLFLSATTALAEDFPGSDSSSAESEFSKGFGADQGMKESDNKKIEEDRLKIGGSLMGEWNITTLQDAEVSGKKVDNYQTSPMSLELYLDSQLKNDIRGFFRGRLINDASQNEAEVSPITGEKQVQNTSYLDELKISMNTKNKIFWTLGKQKIKWGSAKFWNPTDFINIQTRDFFQKDDLRSGISLIKAHIPWKESNFYLIHIYDGAGETKSTSQAFRAEIPFSAAEVSLSYLNQNENPDKYGADLSFSIGDFDFYGEYANNSKTEDEKSTAGISYSYKYSDDDFFTIGYEGYYQENGIKNKSEYLAQILAKKWNQFNIAQSYNLISFYLPTPGTLNNSNFMFYFITNTLDMSQYQRASWSYTGMSDIIWTLALGRREGSKNSEMVILRQDVDASVNLKIVF